MPGISSLLDISRRALFAQTESMRVTSNNVANVNTEGYSRRKVELVSVGSGDANTSAFGNGVDVNKVIRTVDKFLNQELLLRTGDRAYSEIRDELLSRAELPFSVDTTIRSMGFEISKFFSSLEDLQESPSSIPLRQAVIDQGQGLTDSINSTFEILADLQREADSRVGLLVQDVNRITGEIATLNQLILQQETGDQEDLTLRDQRDLLLRDLGEIISFNAIENSQGATQIFLENGFSLVDGTFQRDLDFTPSPSFVADFVAAGGAPPPALDGGAMGFVVYDFDPTAGNSHVDLGSVLAAGSGSLGGLLSLRGVYNNPATDATPFDATGDLVAIAENVEAFARDLLVRYNNEYLGPDEDGGTAGHQPSATDLAGNALTGVFELFTAASATDADADGLSSSADLIASNGFARYASEITFGITAPEDVAAGRDLNAAAGVVDAATGDAQNLDAMILLRAQTVDFNATYAHGPSGALSSNNLYESTVAQVGQISKSNANDLFVRQDREAQSEELRASQSGVSLDEEFAQLINFQRAFEASSRMIRLGDELLQEIIGLLG